MTAQAIWKGVIRFGETAVAVKFYSALRDRKIHFRLLHDKDYVPVQQWMVHPDDEAPIPSDQIRRGYETEDGRIVLLDEEELSSLEPEPSRTITITRFVDPDLLSHQWYDRPYYLGPDGSDEEYVALVEALAGENKAGIARWTMRKKRYQGALRVKNGLAIMLTLRHAEEVIDASELPRPRGRQLEPPERRMAEQLLHALEGDFDPSAFRESYRDRVLDLIDKKAHGVELVPSKKKKAKRPSASLVESLRESIQQAGKERKRA